MTDRIKHEELNKKFTIKKDRKKYWKTKSGDVLLIEAMETNHIINCINMLKNLLDSVATEQLDPFMTGFGMEELIDAEPQLIEQIQIFKNELTRRKQ